MDEITARRLKQTTQSILENEGLTADLDDDAAQDLLDWGIACARLVILSTADSGDPAQEDAADSRLRQVRRMLRQINRWAGAGAEVEAEKATLYLSRIIAQASEIYGDPFVTPDEKERESCTRECLALAGQPRRLIAALRAFIEAHYSPPSNI